MFVSGDIAQILAHGLEVKEVESQIENFRKGFPFISLQRPAIIGDGIVKVEASDEENYIEFFDQHIVRNKVIKFVPASGAASRMFKDLFDFRAKIQNLDTNKKLEEKRKSSRVVIEFLDNLDKFAFFDDLRIILLNQGKDIYQAMNNHEYGIIIDALLNDDGLGYSNLPKGLLKFHAYPQGSRVPIEEHMVEASQYARDDRGVAKLHFTLSPEHIEKFHKIVPKKLIEEHEKQLNTRFDITFSIQKNSTDIIAVQENNEPFRNEDGSLLFRPGGHGSLLKNLNDLDTEIVFIKNIDNLVPDRLKEQTFRYKKIIGGYLLQIKETTHDFLYKSERKIISGHDIDSILMFLEKYLFFIVSRKFHDLSIDEQIRVLCYLLNRPIRVCGMVRNEDEPGGGPFWIKDRKGKSWLQIVESSQIDFSDKDQRSIVKRSTHFNPVDLVCCIRDYKGNPFHLQHFVNRETGFISVKSSGGKTLKAQEHPGLWNGAMAFWLTAFVEVPIITFNPVKTVNDLLRKEHQPI